MRRIRYDVLRVSAALCVLFYHFECSAYDVFPDVATRGVFIDFLGTGHNLGSIAVEVFLLLAGILSVSTLGDSFSTKRYLTKRMTRLLIPFWISWLLVCAWTIVTSSDLLWKNPKWFPLTLLGVDGYATLTLGLKDTFYLVGEWYLGAMIIITLLWPLLRVPFRRSPYVVCFALFALELLVKDLPGPEGLVKILTILPISYLCTFVIGVLIAQHRKLLWGSKRSVVVGLLLVALGLIAPNILITVGMENGLIVPCRQVIAVGVILAVDGVSVPLLSNSRLRGACAHLTPSFVWLSGLSMYFFMFQHVVESEMVSAAAGLCPTGFGSFDYWGLAIMTAVVTLSISVVADGLERELRARCCSVEAPR